MDRDTIVRLLTLAVTNIHFKACGKWFCQRDGVAMGSSLAVILANLWLSQFEPVLSVTCAQPVIEPNAAKVDSIVCSRCGQKVTKVGYSIECSMCKVWHHRKCADLSVSEIKAIDRSGRPWQCGCQQHTSADRVAVLPPTKVFGRYVDDFFRTAKRHEQDKILDTANSLHPSLKFTIELEVAGQLLFLDICVPRSDNTLSCFWYSKPTDTGLFLSFRACAPTMYKRNIVEGTVARVNNATSTWQAFDAGISKAKELFESNQYLPPFFEPLISNSISKIVSDEQKQKTMTRRQEVKSRPTLMMEYRGNISDRFSHKIRQLTGGCTIFTTRTLKTVLPSLKSAVDKEVRSRVVYQITCPGCQSSCVGQTTRHLKTRLTEHPCLTAPVVMHFQECAGSTREISAKIIDACEGPARILTMEALHMSRRQPALNQR